MQLPITPTLLDALTLAEFAFFLRPEAQLYLPGHKGAAFRRGFGSVFKSIACPTHDRDRLHTRLGLRCVHSEIFETPVPSDSAVLRRYPYAPHPFVLTPPLDRQSLFTPGEELRLQLVLVGQAIPRLAYFIRTLEELGRSGIGPRRSRHVLERVASVTRRDGPGAPGATVVYEGARRRLVAAPHSNPSANIRQNRGLAKSGTRR